MDVKTLSGRQVTVVLTKDEVSLLDDILEYYKAYNMPHDTETENMVKSLSNSMFGTFTNMVRARGVGGTD